MRLLYSKYHLKDTSVDSSSAVSVAKGFAYKRKAVRGSKF